jgi:hypothetical protein
MTQQQQQQGPEPNVITEASGIGRFSLNYNPSILSIAGYRGELRGDEEPGEYFATDAAEESITSLGGDVIATTLSENTKGRCRSSGNIRPARIFKDANRLILALLLAYI